MRLAASGLLIISLLTLFACDATEAPLADARHSADAQHSVGPAAHSRVVTLAPNLTELVFAAGAGEYLVGVSAYSNYPPEATGLPVVGDAFTIDQERLALLKPDLLLAWRSGTPAHLVDELRRAGYVVETIRTQKLEDISAALSRSNVNFPIPRRGDG